MSLKILIVDDQEEIRDIIMMSIESEFDCQFVEAENAEAAKELIQQESSPFSLITCDFNMPGGNGSVLYSYLKEISNPSPFIHISTEPIEDHDAYNNFFDDHPGNQVLPKPFMIEQLQQIVSDSLSKSNVEVAQVTSKLHGYHRINIKKFLDYMDQPVDLFISLTDEKYIKIYDREDDFDESILSKYLSRGVNLVYLTDGDYKIFMNSSLRKLAAELSNEQTSNEEKIQLQSRSIQQIRSCILSLGVSQQTIDLTDKVSTSVLQVIKADKNISKQLKKFVKNQGYVFEHSNLINYLSSAIAKELRLDEKNITKLVRASIFCDMTIDDRLAQYQSIEDEKFQSLPSEDRKKIKSHIKEATQILEMSKGFITDEKNIIETHHEKPNGMGFPKKLDHTNLQPLCCIFILAHDFSHKILKCDDIENVDSLSLLQELGEHYKMGNFSKAYAALEKILS